MNILFVHQNFPGQYIHIVKALSAVTGNKVVALGLNLSNTDLPKNLIFRSYVLSRGNAPQVHPYAAETESKVIRAEACAREAHKLKMEGFNPDIILAHPGWGESLFLPDIWPNVPILSYQEFYYSGSGLDTDFDTEIQAKLSWEDLAKVRMKNAYLNLAIQSSAWNVTPTAFQKSTFPSAFQSSISVIHDGIDVTKSLQNRSSPSSSIRLGDGTLLSADTKIITFVNRRLEPYRGCHTMIRAIPEIQKMNPGAHVLIIGSTKGVSYGAACQDGEWGDLFFSEIEGKYDPSLVHLLGTVPYEVFRALLSRSDCHVYLTYPFVLSWSLLEAMSSSCPIVGSQTLPVEEVITNEEHGLLVDFFSSDELAVAVTELLSNTKLAHALGCHARQKVLNDYSLDICLPRQLKLIDLVASRAIGVN